MDFKAIRGWYDLGILIKGMEMPKHCGECGIEWCEKWKRLIIGGMPIAKTRANDCPLIEIPSTDIQPVVHGKWELHGEPPWNVRECSECGEKWHHWQGYELPNYCSNCGAKMDLLN